MKCENCTRTVTPFELIDENAIVPTECDISELRSLLGYFQYRAPNIDALKSQMLDVALHNSVLSEMIDTNRFEYKFCSQNADAQVEFEKLNLKGETICSWCKRFVCKLNNQSKRDKTRKETNLESLLRHLRNSIAHGRVYVIHGGTFITILFVDINTNGNESARIVCRQSDLKKWRSILNKALNSQGT